MPSATQQAVSPSDGTTASGGGLFPKKRPHEEFVAAGPTHDYNHSRDDVLAVFVNSCGSEGSGGNRMSSATLSSRPMLPLAKRVRVDENRCRISPTRPSPEAAHDVLLSVPARANDTTTPMTTATSPSSAAKTPPPSSLTAPCHVCQRRPRRKCDLDSFSDCEGCGERTCFVCLRECLGPWEGQQQQRQVSNSGDGQDVYEGYGDDRATGSNTPSDGSMTPNDEEQRTRQDSRPWLRDDASAQPSAAAADGGLDANRQQQQQQPWGSMPQSRGHRRTICSQCCVERGADGTVVCLGCLAHAGCG